MLTLAGAATGRSEPLNLGARTVELMLTTACNFRCKYCYQKRSAPRTIEPAVLDAAVRRLVSSRYDRPRLIF